jgi:uncharacterized OsmC-like protein
MKTATLEQQQQSNNINGIDLTALGEAIEGIKADPSKAIVGFRVKSSWKGQTRSESVVDAFTMGGETVKRHFRVMADEPLELLGTNTAPNPQELLMSALNACMMVGYVAGAAVHGITLSKLEIETTGELDLRGFLGLDERVRPGYEKLNFVVRIKGNGTPLQFREIHENVMRTSPNYFNIARPIMLDGELKVEK